MTTTTTDLEFLKVRMLEAETLAELHALIVDYTDQEMRQVYHQLSSEEQRYIDAICQQDVWVSPVV